MVVVVVLLLAAMVVVVVLLLVAILFCMLVERDNQAAVLAISIYATGSLGVAGALVGMLIVVTINMLHYYWEAVAILSS